MRNAVRNTIVLLLIFAFLAGSLSSLFAAEDAPAGRVKKLIQRCADSWDVLTHDQKSNESFATWQEAYHRGRENDNTAAAAYAVSQLLQLRSHEIPLEKEEGRMLRSYLKALQLSYLGESYPPSWPSFRGKLSREAVKNFLLSVSNFNFLVDKVDASGREISLAQRWKKFGAEAFKDVLWSQVPSFSRAIADKVLYYRPIRQQLRGVKGVIDSDDAVRFTLGLEKDPFFDRMLAEHFSDARLAEARVRHALLGNILRPFLLNMALFYGHVHPSQWRDVTPPPPHGISRLTEAAVRSTTAGFLGGFAKPVNERIFQK